MSSPSCASHSRPEERGTADSDRRRLRLRDYVQIVNTGLYLVVGVVLLVRVVQVHMTWLGMVIGAGFLGLGLHRARHIWRYFQQE